MTKKQQLISYIEFLNKKLWNEQSKLKMHKLYFHRLFHDTALPLSSTLFAAFIAGWSSGRVPGGLQKIKKIGKFAALTCISHLRKM